MLDILIKNGTLIDGTGAPRRQADVGVKDGRIVAVEPCLKAEAREVIDAEGLVVAPGFVDMHTHYDGQVTWDDQLLPSSAHGVTTIVMGNCGIGFAPVRPGTEDWLVAMTEGVEDIPGAVLSEGVDWNWETFPEYLDFLGGRRFAVDVAAQAPHSAIRAYVMGERTANGGEATEEDIRAMAAIVREAVEAGAVGLGTSRINVHFSSDGNPLPGCRASERELAALVEAMRLGGGGVMQLAPGGVTGEDASVGSMGTRGNGHFIEDEVAMVRRLHQASGLPVTFTFGQIKGLGQARFAKVMDMVGEAWASGETLCPQFSLRPTGAISTLDGFHAFQDRPSYRKIAHLPLAERVRAMRDPAVKAAILAEEDLPPAESKKLLMNHFPPVLRGALSDVYPLDERQDYEPHPSSSITELAKAAGRDPLDYLYDYMLEDDGQAQVTMFATNYLAGDLGFLEQMLHEDNVLVGLADGGAHVRAIVDASQPTFMLTHWGRDRARGPTVPLEQLIKKQSRDTAAFYGLNDRGVVAPGKRADLNIIDIERLKLGRPYLTADLPAGGRRFLQDAEGYVATMVNGVVTRRDDRDTGARPGRLVRGKQAA